MLIITRRIGETITIELPGDDHMEAVVLGVERNQVRIGSTGGSTYPVRRVTGI